MSPGLSVRDALSNLTSVSLPTSSSNFLSNELRGQREPQALYDDHGHSPHYSSPTAAVRVSIPFRIGPPAPPALAGLDSPNQRKLRLPSALGSLIPIDPSRPRRRLYPRHGSVVVPMGLTASGEILHPDHVSSHLSRSHELPRRLYNAPELSGNDSRITEDIVADSAICTHHKASTSGFPGDLDKPTSHLCIGRCDFLSNSYAKIPLFLPNQTPIRDPSQDILSLEGSSLTHEGGRLSQCSPIRRTEQPRTDCPCSDLLHTSPPRHVELEDCLGVEGEWPDGTATDVCSPTLSAKPSHGPPHYQSTNLSNDLGRKGSITHRAMIPTGISQTQCDIEPSETSVRA